jgi:small-conductance mechanosensitive channel
VLALTFTESLLDIIFEWWPAALAAALVVLGLMGSRRVLDRNESKASRNQLRNQLVMLGLSLLGLLIVILNLPIKESSRSDLLHLLGVVLSAAIALSSTTFLSNAMGALMLRSVRNFREGDFIRVGEQLGRVTERGLFHTEIQTEDRDLVTLPNMYLITNPLRVIRPSGTIVSCGVSLGYDVPRQRIEALLIEAAATAGLSDPFVQVTELGDFSVSYRIAGLLDEANHLITIRSNLRKAVMDALHGGGVEIVSPTFMNTRAHPPKETFIPQQVHAPGATQDEKRPEEVIFDKANEAESLAQSRKRLTDLDERLQALRDKPAAEGEAAAAAAAKQLERLERRRQLLQAEIEDRATTLAQEDD